MAKLRFIVVGSGWRSLFYWRIAQALPERFELCAMLCRTEEKAEKMHREYGVPVSTSAEQCIALHPDLVVVAVNKASIAAVSTEWLARGFAVLCETPAALEEDALRALWQLHRQGAKLQVAEQYWLYPTLAKRLAAAAAQAGLNEDETAIACFLDRMQGYLAGGAEVYPLADALQDAYLALLMERALAAGQPLESTPQPWNTEER